MIHDRTTEAIAHFIGYFEISAEQARLRDAYDGFAATRAEVDLGPIEFLSVEGAAPHDLAPEKLTALPPRVSLAPSDLDGTRFAAAPAGRDAPALEDGGDAPSSQPAPPVQITLTFKGWSTGALPPPPELAEAPAASVPHLGALITITDQVAWLLDTDLLYHKEGWVLAGHGELHEGAAARLQQFNALLDTAEGFQPLAALLPNPGVFPDLDLAEAYAAAMTAFAPAPEIVRAATAPHDGGAPGSVVVANSSHAVHGDAALALIVDGESAGEAPSWRDLLPEHHRGVAETGPDDVLQDVEDRALPQGAQRNPDFEDGYSIVTGGNYLANHAALITSWIDAPTIAVAGKWMQLDHIGQAAVASNLDSGLPVSGSAPVTVLQIAEIAEESARFDRTPGNGAEAPQGPRWVHIDHIEGDLLVSHHVRQTIAVNDEDMFGIDIAAASGAYVLGDNTVFNVANILAYGMVYDLILVGGDFITFNAILQTLTLQDDDHFTAAALAPTAPVDDSPGGPALPEVASGHADGLGIADQTREVADDDRGAGAEGGGMRSGGPDADPAGGNATGGDDAEAATFVAAPAQAIPGHSQNGADTPWDEDRAEGTTPAAEAAKDAFRADGAADDDASGTLAADAGASDPDEGTRVDNLLVNEAHLTRIGIDATAELTQSLSEIVTNMDLEMEALRTKLMDESALAGRELARVLKIDGDLIQARIIEQTTKLRDSDDIRVLGGAPEGLEAITGQNALLNIAKIQNVGVDTDVMAGAGAYSDLLIHQAKFIEETDPALRADALVSEAVAFLMDDDLAASPGAGEGGNGSGRILNAADTDDLMANALT